MNGIFVEVDSAVEQVRTQKQANCGARHTYV